MVREGGSRLYIYKLKGDRRGRGFIFKVKGGGGKGVNLGALKMFFHCGKAREGKGVIFLTNSLWDEGKDAPGERVHFDFFSSFFTIEGEGGGG